MPVQSQLFKYKFLNNLFIISNQFFEPIAAQNKLEYGLSLTTRTFSYFILEIRGHLLRSVIFQSILLYIYIRKSSVTLSIEEI